MSNVKEVQNGGEIIVRPVAGRIGAEISGIRLSGNLDIPIVQALKEAILKYKVVFIRNQGHLDDHEQEAFSSLLGKPVVHPTVPAKDGSNYILELNSDHGGRANSWHTDVTFEVAYPKYSILRAVAIPEAGGDTVWANTATAYETLPLPLRSLAEKLWALNMIMQPSVPMSLLKRFSIIKMFLPLPYMKQSILLSMYTPKQVNVIYYLVISSKNLSAFLPLTLLNYLISCKTI